MTTSDAAAARQTSDRTLRCAASILRDGAAGRTPLIDLLDEELDALIEETGAVRAPVWAPWSDDHDELLRVARPVVRRSLLHRRLLVPEALAAELEDREPEIDPQHLVSAPAVAGILLLRRSAQSVSTGVRTFMVEGGTRELRWVHFHQSGGTSLEELVTAEGEHSFSVLPTSSVGERLAELVDPRSVAAEDGAVRCLPADSPPEDWGGSIAEGTTHLSRLVATTPDAAEARAVTVSVTGEGVHLVEGATEDGQEILRIAEVSADSLSRILSGLVHTTTEA